MTAAYAAAPTAYARITRPLSDWGSLPLTFGLGRFLGQNHSSGSVRGRRGPGSEQGRLLGHTAAVSRPYLRASASSRNGDTRTTPARRGTPHQDRHAEDVKELTRQKLGHGLSLPGER